MSCLEILQKMVVNFSPGSWRETGVLAVAATFNGQIQIQLPFSFVIFRGWRTIGNARISFADFAASTESCNVLCDRA